MVDVYLRKGRVLVDPQARLDDYGLWGTAGKRETLDLGVSDAAFGGRLLELLYDDYSPSRETYAGFLKDLGVRSLAAATREANRVTITRLGRDVLAKRSHPAPRGGGWIDGPESRKWKVELVPEELGSAVRLLLELP